MQFIDNHIHTRFSPDGKMTMGQAAEAAIQRGLKGIAFTDHLDLDAPRQADWFVFDIADHQKEAAKVALEYRDKLQIFKGIELGLQPQSLSHIREYIGSHKFDVVLASIHFVDGLDPYYGSYYVGKEYKKAYSRVLELIHSTAEAYKDFDIIGHFDYIARYAPYEVRDIRYKDFPDELDAILRLLAGSGKALEINTKTYQEHKGHLQVLDTAILRRFKELGGECVSLGSDSHEPTRLGENFEYYWEVVKSCGFDSLVYFKERKPIFYNPEKL